MAYQPDQLRQFAAKTGVDLAHEFVMLSSEGDYDGAEETVLATLAASANQPYQALIAANAVYEVCRLVGVGTGVATSLMLAVEHAAPRWTS